MDEKNLTICYAQSHIESALEGIGKIRGFHTLSIQELEPVVQKLYIDIVAIQEFLNFLAQDSQQSKP